MTNELIISTYGSHNATISMYYKNEYHIVEVERWLNHKNSGLTNYLPCAEPQLVFDEITSWLLSQTDRSDADVYISAYCDLKPKFYYKNIVQCLHHDAHAAAGFYQSPYNDALIFTFDGGGDSSYFNVYLASRKSGITLIDKFNQDLGFPYMILADYLADIKKEPLSIGNLVYAGKLMGLCSYGNVRDEWIAFFDEFYDKFNYFGDSYIGGSEARYSAITKLMHQIGVDNFNFETTRFEGQFAWDIAATTQRAFENQFFKYARKYLDLHPDIPIVLSGGCALNVLLNTKLLHERNGKVFVPPNTNDCGISVGGILWYQKPTHQVDLTYCGLPMMDQVELSRYLQDRTLTVFNDISVVELAAFLKDNNIIGILQGRAEHGSRALGNRSILCNPTDGMKDMLNHKVKHREWYRPFAPMVKLEQVNTYFDFSGVDGRHMTFVANVKDQWKSVLPAITHEDGTGRLQTVASHQNKFIYNLLGEFEKLTGYGVILNTSFNDNGKPILSRYADAFALLKNTELDAVYCVEYNMLICKNKDSNKFKNSISNNGLNKLIDDTTIHLMLFTDNSNILNQAKSVIDKLQKDNKFINIITDINGKKELSQYLNDKTKITEIHNDKLYYSSRIKKIDSNNKIQNIMDYNSIISPLWLKESITNNTFNTQYHTYFNISNSAISYLNDIKYITNLAKPQNTVMLLESKKSSEVFTDEFITRKNPQTPIRYMNGTIIHGNYENMLWFTNNYEGMLLWYIDQEKLGLVDDYLLMSYIDAPYRYEIL